MQSITISLDNLSIYIALFCAVVSLVIYVISAAAKRDDHDHVINKIAGYVYFASTIFVGFASVHLMQQILSLSHYDVAYIYDYSGPKDELLYRISSFWAGQEGSLLLWTLFSGIIGLMLIRKRAVFAPATMAFWCSIQTFFLVLLVVADPFRKFAEYLPEMVGQGLNPLLKNPWMAIHPPIVFLGYAALLAPAAIVVQALIKGDLREWSNKALPWAVFGWVSLSAGLILGMVWSYEVLGWGGYWGWDPVENASLVPWLTGTALVHGLVMQRYKGRMAWSNVILALVTFLLVIYATFLTRSGALSKISVHSFSDLGAYAYLLGFLIFYAIICNDLPLLAWKSIKPDAKPLQPVSKDFIVVVGVIVMILFAGVALIGTSLPLLTKVGVKPEFYNNMCKPIGFVAALAILISSFISWSRTGNSPVSFSFSKSSWKSGSHVAHIGVLMMMLGIAFSSLSKTEKLQLPMGGSSSSAMGYDFTYVSREKTSDTTDTLIVWAKHNDHQIKIPLEIVNTNRGMLRKPRIFSFFTGDLYVSPADIKITPSASLTKDGWMSLPAQIPATEAYVTLLGMNVEKREVTLQYQAPGQDAREITVAEGHPATVGDYTLIFDEFVQTGEGQEMGANAGVNLAVEGPGLAERAIIEVSWKPFISLLWIGTALIILGGLMATWRRFREYRTKNYGILPDNN
ncbi:MAG: cytochrome c biogenesis protein CcsA [Armatimonadetes bacterium]|nr:cytochrome c biogenesis protein CcsA [Armatimonadota bacterium]